MFENVVAHGGLAVAASTFWATASKWLACGQTSIYVAATPGVEVRLYDLVEGKLIPSTAVITQPTDPPSVTRRWETDTAHVAVQCRGEAGTIRIW